MLRKGGGDHGIGASPSLYKHMPEPIAGLGTDLMFTFRQTESHSKPHVTNTISFQKTYRNEIYKTPALDLTTLFEVSFNTVQNCLLPSAHQCTVLLSRQLR